MYVCVFVCVGQEPDVSRAIERKGDDIELYKTKNLGVNWTASRKARCYVSGAHGGSSGMVESRNGTRLTATVRRNYDEASQLLPFGRGWTRV